VATARTAVSSTRDRLRIAVALLTRLPVGRIRRNEADLTGASAWFPLVGAVVAGVGVAVWAVTAALFGPLAGAAASVLATVAVTGAVHEDGLADTADGLWGGATRERRLEIMRDSRLGTYGMIALVADLLLRTALLVPLDLAGVARVVVAGHVIGRAAPIVLAAWLPPARQDGLGVRAGVIGRGGATLAATSVLAAAFATVGFWAPLVLAAAAVPVAALRRAAHRRIGGVTGDVLGAGVQMTHLAAAATVAGLVQAGLA